MVCDLQMFTTVTFDCSFVWFIMHYRKKSHVDILFISRKHAAITDIKVLILWIQETLKVQKTSWGNAQWMKNFKNLKLKSVGRYIVSCSIRHSDSQLVHSNQSVRFYIHRFSVTHVIIQLVIQSTNNVIT